MLLPILFSKSILLGLIQLRAPIGNEIHVILSDCTSSEDMKLCKKWTRNKNRPSIKLKGGKEYRKRKDINKYQHEQKEKTNKKETSYQPSTAPPHPKA